MPIADQRGTGQRWAIERAVDLIVMFEQDMDTRSAAALAEMVKVPSDDGVSITVVARDQGGRGAGAGGHGAGAGGHRSLPYDVFDIYAEMEVAGVDDVRRVMVIGATQGSLAAAHRAGTGAIIALANSGSRHDLVDAQPDAITDEDGFAALYRERYGSERRLRPYVLLNPGPSIVSDRVHRAISGPDLCHREPEYCELFAKVRRLLLHVAGVPDDWSLVLLAGSGTAAMEAMTLATVRPGRKMLVCRNGIYGERIETIARRAGIDVVMVTENDLTPIDPAVVAAALEADPLIDVVAVIHHETTTGLLNPVKEIAAEADRRGVLTLCDAISSLGAEDLDLTTNHIDVVASTSNKCLHGLPGCAFLLVSPRGQERIEAVPPRSLYFDLPNYLRAQAKQTVPFTPAIPAIYALRAALEELLDEGLEQRRDYYRRRMEYLDSAFAHLGIEARVAPEHRSRSVRSFPLPPGIAYDALHDAVKRDGYVIYGGLGDASNTSFRVCALGALKIEALEGFMRSFKRAIKANIVVAE